MRFKSFVAGAAGVALLAAPAATSTAPAALPSAPDVASQELAAASGQLDEKPVVVPAADSTRRGDVAETAALTAPAEVPGVVLDAYTTAVALAPQSCNVTVELLAAVGQVESGNLAGRQLDSDHRVTPAIVGPRLDGGAFKAIPDSDKGELDGDKKWDRAVGPMQFLPSTWRSVAVDIDGDGERDPQSIYDAAGAAMVYLCAGRDLSDPAQLREAVLSYNRSASYVAQVLAWKDTFETEGLTRQQDVSFAAFQVPGVVDLAQTDLLASDVPRGKPAGAKGAKKDAATKAKATKDAKQVDKKKDAAPAGKPTKRPVTPPTTVDPTPGQPTATPTPVTPTTPATPDPSTPVTPTPTPTPEPTPEPTPTPVLLTAVMAFADVPVCETPVGAPVEVDSETYDTLVVSPSDDQYAVFPDETEIEPQLILELCQVG